MTNAVKEARELLGRLDTYTAAYDLAGDVRPVLIALCEEVKGLREALNDTLNDWFTCLTPRGRRDSIFCDLVNESAYPLADPATSLLFVRSHREDAPENAS